MVEDDAAQVVGGTYALAWQGELPGTESRTGQFIGRESDERWTMVDYQADFCGRGVEVGDVVLVDVFVPLDAATADEPACRALQRRSSEGAPSASRCATASLT
ncbi:MAG: hypothetical protein R3F60_16390 [bacterium]